MEGNQRLRAARKRMHWSQTEAAKACGVNLQTFFRWERGEQEPHGYNLDQLCRVFHASTEELGYAHLVNVPSEAEATAAPDDQNGLVRLTRAQVAALLPLVEEKTVDQAKRDTLRTILETAGIAVAAPLSLVHIEPWERLASAPTKSRAINQETLQHFHHLLDTCQVLSNGNELSVVEGILGTFLPRLQEAAPYQSEVAELAAQAIQLKSILVAHNLHINDKIALCQMAIEHAKQSGNTNLVATGLLQLGVAYQYAQQPEKALKAQQEALYHVSQTTPLVQSHTYTELSTTLAQFGRTREAEFYMSLAYEVFPQHPEQDPSFAFDDHGFFNLALYKGMMYIHLGQPEVAWNIFEEHNSVINIPERIRLEIINHQSRAALLEGDFDKYVVSLKEGLAGAIALGSKKRFSEAITILQEVPLAWQKEPLLRDVIEQYSLQNTAR